MTTVARYLLNAALFTAVLAAGLSLGPHARAAFERVFAEPPYVTGDYSALYRAAGKTVVVFTTSTCPHCERARELLRREHVDFKEFVADQSAADEQRFRAVGGTAVPLLFVGDRRILGFNEQLIRQSLALKQPAP